MNCLYLTEADVAALVDINDALGALDDCFRDWPRSGKGNIPRGRARQASGPFNLLGASYELRNVFGLKAYFGTPEGTRFQVILYSSETGSILAIIEADFMGQLRTGAATGIATKCLARPDATTLGVIGTGRQAFSQVAAVAAVRPLRSISVYSRKPDKRAAFAARVQAQLGIRTEPAESARACVADADVVVTITKSPVPVFDGTWLRDGTHVNVAGSNSANRREADAKTIQRAHVMATDSIAQARLEAGEFVEGVAAGDMAWSDVVELGAIASGTSAGRQSEQEITLFKSLGIGIEDIAFAEAIYRKAVAAGMGRRLRL